MKFWSRIWYLNIYLLVHKVWNIESTIILEPERVEGDLDVSLIFLHGANVDPEAYIPLGRQLQEVFKVDANIRLWVGMPEIPMMTGVLMDQAINETNVAMNNLGMKASYQFISGHSLGGVRSQEYAREHSEMFTGQILMASCLLREYDNVTYPVPTLTIGGEKDGNMRMTRLAEASHIYREKKDSFPVVVIPGANHMSYASGTPPLPVALVDLTAEVDQNEAHGLITSIILDYMLSLMEEGQRQRQQQKQLRRRQDSSSSSLEKALQETAALVDPIIEAFLMEGSWHFQPPCNSDRPSPHCPFYPVWPPQDEDRLPSNETNCVCGSPWVMQVAQAHVGDLEGYATYVVRDAFHDVRDTEPYHHAHLWNNCTTEELLSDTCVLNITTVSELRYDALDQYDIGFPPVSASEIRVKMKSRQVIYMATIDPEAKLSETDQYPFCAEINKKALQWALDRVPQRTLNRYGEKGVQMVFDDDIRHRVQIGPVWINSPLLLQEAFDVPSNRYVLHVQSTAMVTDVTAHLYPDSSGFHYCKLLSPARAMEWIYVDSLRRYDRQGYLGDEEDGTTDPYYLKDSR